MAYLGLLAYFVSLYIRPQDWVQAVLLWPLDYMIFAGVLFFGLITQSHRVGGVLRMKHFRLMVLWVGAVLLSVLAVGEFAQALDQFLIYFKFLVIFFCFALFVDSFAKLKGLVVFMVFLTLLLAWQGMYQKANGIGWAGQPLGWLGRIKWVGLWDGMNVLCLLFVISFPFLLQMFFGPWGPVYKLYAAFAAPFILYAIYLTDSRGGFMSLMIVVFLHFRTRFQNAFGAALGVMLVAAMCVLAPSRFGDFNDKNKSASYRVDMWIESMEMVKYNPVLGIGKGNFRSYTKKLIAHNSFLEVMGETGFLGLFLWLSLLYVSVMSLIKARGMLEDPRQRSLVDGLLICVLGYLATSLFITAEFELLYVLLALCMVVVRLVGVTVEYRLPDMKRVAFIQAAGVSGFWFFTKIYYRVFA